MERRVCLQSSTQSRGVAKVRRVTDEEKLADYLDYLHMQTVKVQKSARLKLAEVKAAFALD